MKRADEVSEKVQQAVDQLNAHDLAAAEATCREIFALDPKNVNALRILGAVARERSEFDRALEYALEAVRQADRLAVLHFELGVTYFAMHRSRESFEAYLKAIELDPTLYVAYLNCSAIMEQQERFAKARDWALKTLQIKPDYALAHYNLANSQRELGAIDDAIRSYELAHRYRPEHPKTLWNLGICHLLSGNFRDGWPLFERRQDAEEVMIDRFTEPRWDGSPLDGRTIAVHAEQGIGDEILFASCFPDVIARAKNGRCVLICDPRLERLFARSFPEAKVYPHARRSDWSPPILPERIDVQIPAGSLPLHFRATREAFPRRKRFLVVEPKLEAMWRDRLAALGGEMKIGISWRAGGKPTERRKRSIPLEQWGKLLATPGVRFVNLQYGDATADLAAARARFGIEIHDWEEGDPLVDVDSYVAKISALDLVISVGNATVHMAGAVGTPAWTLLPTLPSWRWMIAGDVSPWYCGVRLFRQEQRGEWRGVLERIARLLERVAGTVATVEEVEAGRAKPQASGDANSRGNEKAEDAERWLGATELVGHEILDTVNRLVAEAQLAERLGDLSQAESKYREVLQLAPRHAKALCGLGIVARKTNRSELAIRCFRRAIAVVEPVADHHLHLADALLDAGRVDEAVAGYQRALDLDPAHAGAQLQIGRVLRQNGRHKEAARHLRSVLAIDSSNHEALVELGRGLAAGCRIDEAIDCFQQALRLEPGSAAALEAMGSVYLEDHCYDDAENCFRKAVALNPGRAESHFHLARALNAQGRSADAAAALEQSVALDPKAEGPLFRLALVRRAQGDLDAAAELLRRAAVLKPEDVALINLLGVVLREQGQTADALHSFERALQLQPDHADAHLNRALALLQAGRLAAGWREYEWRGRHWQTSLASGTREDGQAAIAGGARSTGSADGTRLGQDAFPQPRWNGESLTGRTILVHGEQSLAEEVMFASCYEDVIAQAALCVVVCDPRMERLFKRSFPAAQVFPVVRGGEAQWRMPADLRCDVQIPAGSLPLHLRGSASSFPRPHHFLTADAARVARWRERYATTGEGLKIGLAWQDEGRRNNGHGKNFRETNLGDWRSLVQWSGSLGKSVQWINLQDGQGATAERATLQNEMGVTIHDWSDAQSQYDLDDVAARIAALDLVISAGGVPAHLGGALGLPGWVVVRPEDEWRWLGNGDATPWYPSVRLFHSEGPKTSIKPMECLRDELLKRLEHPAEEQRMRSTPHPHWGIDAAERDALL
jgi:tetratricopeptide (TPR) repeat protein